MEIYEPFKSTIIDSSLPVPIFTINYRSGKVVDLAMATVLMKRKFEAEKNTLRRRASATLSKMKNSEDEISQNMVKYIELVESEPSPFIGTEYDWRFSGGNLDTFYNKSNKDLSFIQASMCDDYDLRIFKPRSKLRHIDLSTKPSRLSKNYGYEILSSKRYLGLRKAFKINLIKREDIDSCTREIKMPIEFKWKTEIAACTLTNKEFIIVDVNYNLIRTSIDSLLVNRMQKLNKDNQDEPFVPITLSSFDKLLVGYSDLKSLNSVDFRCSTPVVLFDQENFVMKCEEISYHKTSGHDNLMYIASSHLLYAIDRRMPKKTLVHWNHHLIQQPTMLKTLNHGKSNEILCLSSTMPGDMKIFNCGKGTQENSKVVNWLPYKPKNLKESYRKLRGQGMLLLSEPIKERVELSTTGIALVNPPNQNFSVDLYTQNSIGDVFKSKLYLEGNEDEEVGIEKNFNDWDEAVKIDRKNENFWSLKERLAEGDLQFTDIVNLRGLKKVMLCQQLQTKEETDVEDDMQTTKIPKWKCDLQEEKQYCDVLSQVILSQWDLEIEETRPPLFDGALETSRALGTGSNDKVSWWLETTSVDDSKNNKEFDELLTEPLEPEVNEDDTQRPSLPKKPKKITKRVKGF